MHGTGDNGGTEETGRAELTAIGLMSGTSLDGIDIAVIRTDGERVSWRGPSATYPYVPELRERIRGLLGRKPGEAAARTIDDLTDAHAEAVLAFADAAKLDLGGIDLVGFHGHTVFHDPDHGVTCQVGDGARLAGRLDRPVVSDFRSNDVLAGGQGAPLAPLYHAALARPIEPPLCVLNLGGVGNLTWISPDGAVVAFDTGPGNALLDDWMRRRTGHAMDADGLAARSGKIDEKALARLMQHPYFRRAYPKSLDRDAFDATAIGDLSTEDGAATLAAFTAEAVKRGRDLLPAPPLRWLVTGGGRHNPALMAELRLRLDSPVEPVEAVGWRGDFLEAEAFGFLAVRSYYGLPLSLPATTGVPGPQTGGRLDRP